MNPMGCLGQQVLKYLKPISKIWQPADFLPIPHSESFLEDVLLSSV